VDDVTVISGVSDGEVAATWERRGSRSSFGASRHGKGRTLDAREAWIQRRAAELRAVLADPQARAEVLALLSGDDPEVKRQRRLAELETERREGEPESWKSSS
jgi:hypothetical protein